jgi:hypothetical protein
VRLRLGIVVAAQHDFSAERFHRVDLDLRRRPRHDDDRADAEPACREGDALRVIAGAGGNDAASALRLRQARDAIVGAADLETENRL